jgi:hypothetical protein
LGLAFGVAQTIQHIDALMLYATIADDLRNDDNEQLISTDLVNKFPCKK